MLANKCHADRSCMDKVHHKSSAQKHNNNNKNNNNTNNKTRFIVRTSPYNFQKCTTKIYNIIKSQQGSKIAKISYYRLSAVTNKYFITIQMQSPHIPTNNEVTYFVQIKLSCEENLPLAPQITSWVEMCHMTLFKVC